MPRKPKPNFAQRMRDLLGWFRGVGIATGLLGGVCLVQAPEFFYFSVACVYTAIVLLAIDLFFEPFFARWSRSWQVAAILSFIAVLTAFSLQVVFVNCPLEVSAFMTDAEYPAGTTIAGIAWRPEFTEVVVGLNNPSRRNYDDLNVVMRANSAIAAIAQLTSIADVTFALKDEGEVRLATHDVMTGKNTAVPFSLLATDGGYRLRCGRLPARSEIRVVIALADIKWNPSPPNTNQPLDKGVQDPSYMFRMKLDDFSTYWYGHASGNVYTPRPTSSDWMRVNGYYTAAQKVRGINEKIDIGGNLAIKP